uniref:Uncharacterized protein n=1 Tax=Marseillevirus LCMAC103 TaxID=2506604 RepID=A0A481YV62_9VIRU|nr:MAG: hypothetical protein LCMAC103_02700 [Marseillevirus LCMAC103]
MDRRFSPTRENILPEEPRARSRLAKQHAIDTPAPLQHLLGVQPRKVSAAAPEHRIDYRDEINVPREFYSPARKTRAAPGGSRLREAFHRDVAASPAWPIVVFLVVLALALMGCAHS